MLNQIKAFSTIRSLSLLLAYGSVLSTTHSQILAQETRWFRASASNPGHTTDRATQERYQHLAVTIQVGKIPTL